MEGKKVRKPSPSPSKIAGMKVEEKGAISGEAGFKNLVVGKTEKGAKATVKNPF